MSVRSQERMRKLAIVQLHHTVEVSKRLKTSAAGPFHGKTLAAGPFNGKRVGVAGGLRGLSSHLEVQSLSPRGTCFYFLITDRMVFRVLDFVPELCPGLVWIAHWSLCSL